MHLNIRVADFGLTRDIYSNEYYRVDKHTILPVKWMAMESILDGYFDEKTDVVCEFIIISGKIIIISYICMHVHMYMHGYTCSYLINSLTFTMDYLVSDFNINVWKLSCES